MFTAACSALAAVVAVEASNAPASSPAAIVLPAGPGVQGVPWPRADLLPRFAPVRQLEVADMTSRSDEEKLLFSTLQGLVNRSRPRIYLIEGATEGAGAWPSTFAVPQRRVADPWTLVSEYRPLLSGVVIYDPNVPDSINVATSMAGVDDAVVASPALAARLTAAPYRLKVIADLRHKFSGPVDAYTWELTHLWARANHRLLVGADPISGLPYREADGTAQMIYRFVIPPGTSTVSATIYMWGQYRVAATSVNPNTARPADWRTVALETRRVHDGSNRNTYTIDLSAYSHAPAVFLRFTDARPDDGFGPAVQQTVVKAGENPVADFSPGSPYEGYFLFSQHGTTVGGMGPYGFVHDYAVANRALVVWLDPSVPAEKTLIDRSLAAMSPGGVILGAFASATYGETEAVDLASQHSIITVPDSGVSSLTALSAAYPVTKAAATPTPPPLQNKIYVNFLLSDGDNLQYDEHRMRQLWDDPARGSVPLTWSISALTVEAAPRLLDYYTSTASQDDSFVAGPSGAGYIFPNLFPGFAAYAQAAAADMRLAGITGLYALNHVNNADKPLGPSQVSALIRWLHPSGVALNLWFGSTARSFRLPDGTPLTYGRMALTASQMLSQIQQAAKGWDGKHPLFITEGVLAWSLGPSDVKAVADRLGPRFQAVRGDQYFALLREAGW